MNKSTIIKMAVISVSSGFLMGCADMYYSERDPDGYYYSSSTYRGSHYHGYGVERTSDGYLRKQYYYDNNSPSYYYSDRDYYNRNYYYYR